MVARSRKTSIGTKPISEPVSHPNPWHRPEIVAAVVPHRLHNDLNRSVHGELAQAIHRVQRHLVQRAVEEVRGTAQLVDPSAHVEATLNVDASLVHVVTLADIAP